MQNANTANIYLLLQKPLGILFRLLHALGL
jgi:hypothetical protein